MQRLNAWFEDLLTRHRGWFATFILLPIGVLFWLYRGTRRRLAGRIQDPARRHAHRVEAIIGQIEAWKREGCREKLCTARSGWNTMSEMVPRYKLTHRPIRVDLDGLLGLDEERQTVWVEPLVTMGQLSRHLLSKGWTLPVVPELDDLTVGGLIMGFGVESSSHKYGLFQHLCQALEIVTAEGKRLRLSASENPELYYLIPWSHGTLGFLVAAELTIIPAPRSIRLHYQPVYSLEALVGLFERAARDSGDNDFVEALVYDRDRAVLMRGSFCAEPGADGPWNALGRWYKPWFYRHVRTYLEQGQEGVEYVPVRDYFHRHTRSYFWTMEEIIPFGNHPLFRWLLGWALPPPIPLLKYTETETTRRLREKFHVLQDLLMPIRHLKESLLYLDRHYGIYPLWLCPMKIPENPYQLGFLHPFRDHDGTVDELLVDIGIYGASHRADFDGRAALPALERFVIEHGGYQALYAKTTLSREDFRRMFDHSGYDRLRAALPYCRDAFDEVYDKVSSRGRVAPVEMKKLLRQRRMARPS